MLHKQDLDIDHVARVKRELSVIDNFEVLRRVFLDAMKERNRGRRVRATRTPRVWQDQIQDNQNIFDSIG